MRALKRTLAAGLAATLLATGAAGQKLLDKDLPANHPRNDPYTRGEAELMEGAGIVSHGGFEFGNSDTAGVEDLLATSDIRWLETEHFELGLALGTYRVPQKEKKKIRADLARLAQRLPTVNPKAKTLDPWLRTHLFAMRLEEMYDDFLELVQVEQSVFPDGSKPWDQTGTYWGEGPHLGQKGKYEVLILPSEASHLTYLSDQFGLQIKRTQRWNVPERDTLTVTIHVQQGTLKADPALHGHLAFNLAHNFFDGLRHYTYDTPIWLHEGLAHFLERRIDPRFNSFDGAEGSIPEMSRKSDWETPVKKLVNAEKAPRLAALVRKNNYGQLSLDDHFCTWSMIDFLHRTRPEGLAALLVNLKGRTGEDGFGDGSNLPEAHRELFKEQFGMSYSQFDSAWAEWVLATY